VARRPIPAAPAIREPEKGQGIDLDDVFRVFESEGIEKFEQAWNELLQSVSEELATKK